jgi:hypothetical protein
MDDKWGNILYLIVMALFVIVGALKKKKPVAVQPPDDGEIHHQTTSEAPSGFETLFETLLGSEIPKPYVQPIEDATPEREETMMEEYTRLESLKAKAYEDKKSSALSDLKLIYNEEEQIESDEYHMDEIDWRQAIIYKEILDRKYI